jgi:hypothetical protein
MAEKCVGGHHNAPKNKAGSDSISKDAEQNARADKIQGSG